MIRALVAGCHPGPTAAVTLIAVLLGAGVGLGPARVVLLGGAVLCGQLAVGWSNDALDAVRDLRSGRLDKPVVTGRISRQALAAAAASAAAGTIALSLALGRWAAVAQLLLPAAGIAYNLGLKSTWWSAACYAVGFAALPAAPYLALPGHPAPPWGAPVSGALLGVAAHIANVLPDLGEDLHTGVRGLPHRIGRRASTLLLGGALAAAAASSAIGPGGTRSPALSAVAVAAVAGAAVSVIAAWRRPGSEVAFYAVVGVAVLDVLLLILRG